MIKETKLSYLIVFTLFFLAIEFHFISLFFVFTLTFTLINKLNSLLIEKIKYHQIFTKTISVLIIAIIMLLLIGGIHFCFVSIKNNYLTIIDNITFLLSDLSSYLPKEISNLISIESFKENAVSLVSDKKGQIISMTILSFHFLSHCIIGIILGVIFSFNRINACTIEKSSLLVKELNLRFNNYLDIFEKIFLSQGKISLINTFFTGIYLLGVLPILGYKIPYSGYLLFATFIFGLLPVIGNLISNTLILIFSITVGIKVVIGSLIFLVLIHKFEYYINSLILGKKINLNLFEIIIAMVMFEGLLGIKGLFLATLLYSYIKSELKIQKLI